jgi:hypothetical protein
VLRKLLVSVSMLVISLIVAISAFAQTMTQEDSSNEDISQTQEASEEASGGSSTSPSEAPSSSSSTDWNSILGSVELSDVCPAVLNPAVIDQFRTRAPSLVEACENANLDTVPTDQGTAVSPSNPNTTTTSEQLRTTI